MSQQSNHYPETLPECEPLDPREEPFHCGYYAAIAGETLEATIAQAEASGAPFGDDERAALVEGHKAGCEDRESHARDMASGADYLAVGHSAPSPF